VKRHKSKGQREIGSQSSGPLLFGAFTRLVTFENLAGASRIGAYAGSGQVIDLNSACALRLRDQQHEEAFDRLANALVPPNMRALFEGGDTSLNGASNALDFALKSGNRTSGCHGEPLFYNLYAVRLRAPVIPKKFFHTAGNFREDHEEATKAGFSHPVMP